MGYATHGRAYARGGRPGYCGRPPYYVKHTLGNTKVNTLEANELKMTQEINAKQNEITALNTKVSTLEAKSKKPNKALPDAKLETEQKLKDGATRDQYRHWLHCTDLLVGRADGWENWPNILRSVRLLKESVNDVNLRKLVSEWNTKGKSR